MKIAQLLEIPGYDPVQGPLNQKPGGPQFDNLASVVNNAVPILFAFAGMALFVYLVWGGFDYLTSMGDAKKAEQGKNKITHAVIGFVILFASFWIVQLADLLLGFQIF